MTKKKTFSPQWTEAEDARLREAYGTLKASAIACELNRTESAVFTRKKKLGLCAVKGARWKPSEDNLLRELWGRIPIKDLVPLFKRPASALAGHAQYLGITKSMPPMPSRERYLAILTDECAKAGVPLKLALSKSLCQPESLVRFRAWTRLKEQGFSFPGIGAVAGRDHTTIVHGTRRLRLLSEAG